MIWIRRYCSVHDRILDHLYLARDMALLSVSRMCPSAASLVRLSISDQACNFIGIATEAWPLVPSELPQPDLGNAGLVIGALRYGRKKCSIYDSIIYYQRESLVCSYERQMGKLDCDDRYVIGMSERPVHQSFLSSSSNILHSYRASAQSLRELLDTLRVVLVRRLASTTRLTARRSSPSGDVVSKSMEHRRRSAITHP
jgi:hypothetical protein